jgi:MFS family permease
LLWAGQSLSLLGDQFAVLALPLLALEVVGASPAAAALLPFALFAPFLVLGLPSGAIVDRLPRRSTMLVCEAVQALTFAAIALLAIADALAFPILLALVAVSGCALVFFQVAYTSYLPELLATEAELQSGNAKLFLSESLSRTVGPIVAGPVIAALGAVAAICANTATFLGSLLTLGAIRARRAPAHVAPAAERSLRREIREGIAFVVRHDRLAPVISCGVVYVVFLTMVETSLVLYCRSELGLTATGIGLVVGTAGAGFPIGNLLSSRLLARLGPSRTLVCGATVAVLGLVATPIAGSAGSLPGLVLAGVIHGVGEGTFGPTALTMRQLETPPQLLGRVNAVQRFLIWGAGPLGSLLAVGCIQLSGLGAALWLGGLGTALCLPALLRRGVLRELRAPRPASRAIALDAAPTPSAIEVPPRHHHAEAA